MQQVEPRLLEVSRVLGLSARERAFKIVLPAIVPRLFVALRLGVAVALVVAVTVEIAANPHGMGYAMMIAQQSFDPALMLAWLGWIGVVGFAINAAHVCCCSAVVARRMGVRAMNEAGRRRMGTGQWLGALARAAARLLRCGGSRATQAGSSRVFLPTPQATFASLREGLNLSGTTPMEATASCSRSRRPRSAAWSQGWLLASLFGVVLGAAIGVSPAVRAWVQPTLEFMRPLPASALLPLAISIFGLNPGMVLFVVAFGAMWPVLLATVHGFAAVEPRLSEVARCLQMSRAAFVWKMGLPNAMPDILAGMRLALTIALIVAVVGEMIASQSGLGQAILLAARAPFAPASFSPASCCSGSSALRATRCWPLPSGGLLRWQQP